jgi:hypothetical protein
MLNWTDEARIIEKKKSTEEISRIHFTHVGDCL